jgi:Asp-tRNA(Asn)/Glu-tRNA(Gln) amidotransferase A subunit family amidase
MPGDDAYADVARLTLCAAAAGIRSGQCTAEDLAQAYLDRIRRHEPRVRAWVWLDPERMLAEARQADAELRAGSLRGPLHGIPLGIKDIIHTRGIPTRMGSPIFDGFVPHESAACVELLQQAGAYVQGKTVTTEFATREPGPTTNPWNASCTPGGSSSGSAAAVASWFTAAALGTQTRGSLIRPAAYCGVVGFKPTLGVVSTKGVHPLSGVLDHVGILARDVDDAALVCAAVAGSGAAGGSMSVAAERAVSPVERLVQPPHLAKIRTAAWGRAEESQRVLFEADSRRLLAAGARLTEVELPARFREADEATTTIQLFDIARNFEALERDAGDRMSESFRASCQQGARVSDAQYREALDLRLELQVAFERIVADFDAVVTPPATGEAPAQLSTTGDPAFCTLWTLLGTPCLAIPTGWGSGALPLGLQIVGRYLDDARTLAVAKWCSQHLPFDSTPPF